MNSKQKALLKDIIKAMECEREISYKAYNKAELEEDGEQVAYKEGELSGIDRMIELVKTVEQEDKKNGDKR